MLLLPLRSGRSRAAAVARQHRGVFDGIHAAMKTLKKRGAHPDVLRGRFPEASEVNAAHLPVLEQFLAEYRKRGEQSGKGDPPARGEGHAVHVRLFLMKEGHAEPQECSADLSLAWPARRVKAALQVFFDPQLTGAAPLGEDAGGAGGEGLRVHASLLDHLKKNLAPAKARQKHLQSLRTQVRVGEDAMRNLHAMKVTRDAAVGDADYVRMLGFLSNYCKSNHHVRDSHIHVASHGKPGIAYEDSCGKGVDGLGTVTLPSTLLRAEGDDDLPPNFGHWRYIADRVNWPRMAASYAHKQKVTGDFWQGMEAACKNLSEKLGVHAVTCDAVGPILDGMVTQRRVLAARQAAQYPTTGHDFVAVVAKLAHAVRRREVPFAVDGVNTVMKRHLRVLLRPDFCADGAAGTDPHAAMLDTAPAVNAAALHTGEVLLRVQVGADHLADVPQRLEAALSRFALQASLAAAQYQRVASTVSRLAKSTGIRVSADVTWTVSEGALFLDRYERAVDELYRQRGRMMAHRLHGLELCIGDECLYDPDRGILTLQWDADFDDILKLPVSIDAVGA